MDEKGGGAAVKNSHEKSVYETILIQHNSIYLIDRSFTNYMDKRPFFSSINKVLYLKWMKRQQ